MSSANTNPPGQITISPLLKNLVSHCFVRNQDITAALILINHDGLSAAQVSLLLGLLKARKYDLTDEQLHLLECFLTESKPLSTGREPDSIASVLRSLLDRGEAPVDKIAGAFALILEDRLSAVQSSLLLGLMAFTGLDKDPVVLVKTAEKMLAAANRADRGELNKSVLHASGPKGIYRGGLCDIVGTGGDGHSTFNVSTTASIIASSHLALGKHGNRASSSTSGSADLLESVQPRGPKIEAVTAENLPAIYRQSSYAFLFAPKFHPGMKYVAPLRKDLGIRTIFNVLGPLVNPVEDCIEARIVGVAERRMGPVFAEALRLSGAKKAMVVCGAEDLDEISCAGKTFCWRLFAKNGVVDIDEFGLEPADFGLPPHPLSEVAGGKLPQENARILVDLLDNKLGPDDPVLHFVLINAAALFAIAGVCEDGDDDVKDELLADVVRERGPGGQRWKEGIRLARESIENGLALKSFRGYIDATYSCHN